MERFAQLFEALDASTATQAKVRALVAYLREAPQADAAWAVTLLAGGRPRRVVGTAVLRQAACEAAGIDDWLFEASYVVAGDLAETIAHLLPAPAAELSFPSLGLGQTLQAQLLPLKGLPAPEQIDRLKDLWRTLTPLSRFLTVKLIGGGFRVGVSRLLVQQALAEAFGLNPSTVAQRMVVFLAGEPTATALEALVAPEAVGQGVQPWLTGHPCPFFLAHPLPEAVRAPLSPTAEEPDGNIGSTDPLADLLGDPAEWIAEWKYDGIRAQIVRGNSPQDVWIWSRGEELMSGRFPELEALAAGLPAATVLDGEILVWRANADTPEPFQTLQQRIQRQSLSTRLLAEAPVRFLAYDLLVLEGQDLRGQGLIERRGALQRLLAEGPFTVSPRCEASDWAGLRQWQAQSRDRGVEGLMLKQASSRYGLGRSKADGLWWKWKVEPFCVDAVLIYAQAGHGRRASLYTDYTLALWNRPPVDAAEAQAVADAIARREPPRPDALQLLSFAKAYSGLADAELAQVDRLVRATTVDSFGPVRSVKPTLVIEIAFEGLQPSKRHKSGWAVRFPRMVRLRPDKPLHEADDLQALAGLSR